MGFFTALLLFDQTFATCITRPTFEQLLPYADVSNPVNAIEFALKHLI
jgi:hypothetical protein